MGKRGPIPKQLTDTTWRPELAYVVGLLAADGCLSSDGLLVEFTSKDPELVVLVKHILNLNAKIGKKSSGSNKQKAYFRIQCKNRLLYDWLLSIGLMPRKSKTLRSITVPDKFFFDFFRGLYDGDGTMYAYWDPRWRSSYMYYVAIVSASPIFLLWLQVSIERLIGVRGAIAQSKNFGQLRFAKAHSQILLTLMYPDEQVPHLRRKFTKSQKIIKIDESHIRAGGGI